MGTINIEMPRCLGAEGSVRAASQTWVETCAALVHNFWPLITQSSPSFVPTVSREARSVPAFGSAGHVQQGDPPVFLFYGNAKGATVKGETKEDPTHAPLLGAILMEKLNAVGVEGIFVQPGKPHEKYKNSQEYLIDRLTAKTGK